MLSGFHTHSILRWNSFLYDHNGFLDNILQDSGMKSFLHGTVEKRRLECRGRDRIGDCDAAGSGSMLKWKESRYVHAPYLLIQIADQTCSYFFCWTTGDNVSGLTNQIEERQQSVVNPPDSMMLSVCARNMCTQASLVCPRPQQEASQKLRTTEHEWDVYSCLK